MLELQRFIKGAVANRQGGAVLEQPAPGRAPLVRGGFPRPALPDAKIPQFLKTPSAKRWRQVALALLPTFLAILYFGFLASDRYVSEAQFVVRTPSKQAGNLSFGSLLQMTGLGQSADDSYSVEQFLTSRDALRELMAKLPLRQIYDRHGADFISRYPSFFYGSSQEEFYKYFQWMVDVVHDGDSGITTLRVQAFSPEDANRIASTMLQLGEQMVNRLNERISADSIRVAQQEVNQSEQRLVAAELALTNFRTRELMIDPAGSSLAMTKLVETLGGEQSEAEAEIKEIEASSPRSPQLEPLRRKAQALASQIVKERSQVAGVESNGGLADKLSQYERLVIDREFATKLLTTATTALEGAKSEARRQQLYLERVVEPNTPDYATRPERLRTIATVFAFNIIFLLVLATIITGVREHSAAQH